MAHDKSARFGKLVTQTPPVVGPGSYDIYEPSKPPRDLQCAYPFLKGATRKTFELSKDVSSLPGPGSYDPVDSKQRVPGGVSIDFTDVRLKSKIYEGPGPGSYNLSDNLFKIGVQKLRSHPGTWRGSPGNLWLGQPPRSIIDDSAVAAVPKCGVKYCSVKRRNLVKNSYSCCDDIEPPDFYDIPRGETNFTTLRYKGNFWSMMSGRDEKKIEKTPGPGSYEVDKPINVAKMWDEKYRSIKRAESRKLRYLDELSRKKMLENYPAPNAYDPLRGPFDIDTSCDCDESKVSPPAFGQSAKRYDVKIPDGIPGPGTYDPVAAKCAPCSIVCAPFGACAPRFHRSINDLPGPGSYDLTKDDLAKRIFTICKRSYARPSMPLRFDGSSISHEDAGSEYSIPSVAKAKKSRVHHAVFKSTTSRFKDARLEVDTPGPGHYDLMPAFKASRDPCHLARRSLTTSFASRTLRFPRIPEGMDLQIPGPGIYNLSSDIAQGVKGGVVADAKKRTKARETTPGPSRYYFHPYVESSVVRRSHNVTLGKPKILQRQKKTKNSCMARNRSKKILRWFVKPNYEHCSF